MKKDTTYEVMAIPKDQQGKEFVEQAPAFLVQIESSNLRAIGWNFLTQTLDISFGKNSLHRYTGVPHELWLDFLKADSYGKFFHKHILSGNYDFKHYDKCVTISIENLEDMLEIKSVNLGDNE